MKTIDNLLETALSKRRNVDNAIRALGLLLEKRHVKRPRGDDGGLGELLGPELASYNLSDAEAKRIVLSLSLYVLKKRVVKPGIIWALNKSADRLIIPVLGHTLLTHLKSREQQYVTEQALNGLILFLPETFDLIKRAAEEGLGDVKDIAESFVQFEKGN